jgi:hypothetical protein
LEAQILPFTVGRIGHGSNRDRNLIGGHLLILAHRAVFRATVVDLPLRRAQVRQRMNLVWVAARFIGYRQGRSEERQRQGRAKDDFLHGVCFRCLRMV